MAISKISEICKQCVNYDKCANKRMEACAYAHFNGENQLAQLCAEEAAPLASADMLVKHDYRDVKIAENTTVTIDLEDMKKKLQEDIYKGLMCGFLGGC